jgi:hypothetical protein
LIFNPLLRSAKREDVEDELSLSCWTSVEDTIKKVETREHVPAREVFQVNLHGSDRGQIPDDHCKNYQTPENVAGRLLYIVTLLNRYMYIHIEERSEIEEGYALMKDYQ